MSRILRQGQVLAGGVQNLTIDSVKLIDDQLNALLSGDVGKVITNFSDFGFKQINELQEPLSIVSRILLIISGLIWLGVAIHNKNYASLYLANNAKILYIAFGVAAIYTIYITYINTQREPETFDNLSDDQRVLIKQKVAQLEDQLSNVQLTADQVSLIKSKVSQIKEKYNL